LSSWQTRAYTVVRELIKLPAGIVVYQPDTEVLARLLSGATSPSRY
jgi:hypothetical protein